MGSALTVLLSVSRSLNLSLATTILLELVSPYKISPSLSVVILFFLFIALSGSGMPLMNYYEYQLPKAVELILVYVLLGLLYFITRDEPMFFIITALVFSVGVYASLFPTGEFDKRAASNFWEGPLRINSD